MGYPDPPGATEQPEWHLWYGAFGNILQGEWGFGPHTQDRNEEGFMRSSQWSKKGIVDIVPYPAGIVKITLIVVGRQFCPLNSEPGTRNPKPDQSRLNLL